MEEDKFSFSDGCFFKTEPIKEPEAVIQEFYEIYNVEHVKTCSGGCSKLLWVQKIGVYEPGRRNRQCHFLFGNLHYVQYGS